MSLCEAALILAAILIVTLGYELSPDDNPELLRLFIATRFDS